MTETFDPDLLRDRYRSERDKRLRADANEQYVEMAGQFAHMAQYNVRFLEACTPGYYNNEGRPAERTVRNGSYGAGSPAFIRVLEQWREADRLEGLELSP